MSREERTNPLKQRHILRGKLKPPQLRYVVDRPRLLRMVSPADANKLVLICAGPGYGKTTLMAQIARFYPGRNIWYQIDSIDKDPVVFLKHLIIGVAQVCEGVGDRSMSRLAEVSDAEREGASVLAVLADELSEKLQTPLAICFDDFHLFDGMKLAADFMSSLITELPDNCTVFISSRTRPRLRLGRLRSHGATMELGQKDLQFSMDEMKELLNETWSISIDVDTLFKLHRNTEGWAAGLVLIEDHLRSGIAVPELFSGRKVRRNVYEYLAEEVLSRQSERLRDLLEKSSLINPVDPYICQKALGIKDAPALISIAEKMNLFTTRVDDTDLYRYHPLFREILLARLRENLSAVEIDKLRVSFGSAYEDTEQKKNAIEQYLKSGQPERALKLIEEAGDEMLKNGEHVTLERWLEKMDEPLSLTLQMYHGQLLLLAGKPHEALNLLRAVKTKLKNSADKTLICDVSVSIAECHCMLGKPKKGISEIEPVLSNKLPSENRLNLLHRLSFCYWDNYDDEGVRKCIKQAKKIALENPSSQLLSKVEAMLAGKCLRNGEFTEARRLLSTIVEADGVDASNKNLYMNNLSSCLMMLGRYDEAKELIEKCISRVKAQNEEKWLGLIYDTYGSSLVALDSVSEGKKYMQKSINHISEKSANDAEACPARCHLGTLARRQGDNTAALDFHSECLKIASKSDAQYDIAIGLINIGADHLRGGNHDEAEQYFLKGHKLSIDHNFRYALTHVDFHRAWLHHEDDNVDLEIDYLKCALKRSKKYQHNHFLIQEGKISLPLFTTALKHEIETEYICWILEKIGSKAVGAIAPLIDNERKDVRARCIRLLSTYADPSAIALVRKLVRDEDNEVKKLACIALADLREKIQSPGEILTSRENQVLELIAKGSSNGRIAKQLYVSERTVKTHVTNIFRKLGLTSRLEAALYYRKISGE